MSDRAPWFKCFPSLLLGAISAMSPEEGYTYTVLLMRIYEADGPVPETSRTLARRTGLSERKVAEAVEGLIAMGKVQRLPDGRLDSETTHGEIAARADRREAKSEAGKASAERRSEARNKVASENDPQKNQQNQQSEATAVQRNANEKEIEGEVEIPSETTSLRGAQASRGDGAVEALQPKLRKRGSRLPADWWPDDELKVYARQHLAGDDRLCRRETERFKNHWAAAAGSSAVKLDWRAAYRNWILKAAEMLPGIVLPPPPPSPVDEDAQWRRKLKRWRETGEWNGHWGNHPETPGFQALCPKHILREFNLERPAA